MRVRVRVRVRVRLGSGLGLGLGLGLGSVLQPPQQVHEHLHGPLVLPSDAADAMLARSAADANAPAGGTPGARLL